MTNRTIADRILELARSETKRWGGTEPSLTHVAFVMANHWQKEFDAVFGSHGRDRVMQMLDAGNFPGDEESARTLLAKTEDISVAILAVHEALRFEEDDPSSSDGSVVGAVPEPIVASREEWLTTPITDRLTRYAKSPSEQLLGELTALITTLKVVGLDDAYQAMNEKLESLTSSVGTTPDGRPNGSVDSADALSGRTSRFVHRVPLAQQSLRQSESTQIAAQLLRPKPPIIAIVGEPGVGRTALLSEVAARLNTEELAMPIWRLSPETIIANASSSLKMALDDVTSPAVIVIDDLDVLADFATQRPDHGLLETISDAQYHPFARIILVVNQRRLNRIAVLNAALDEWMFKVSLSALPQAALTHVVTDAANAKVSVANLEINDSVVPAALAVAESDALEVHPGLAISRIDAAIGRALLDGAKVVGVEHLSVRDSSRSMTAESIDVSDTLHARVRGQDKAIATVASRLAITRVGLDLRPHRPNGVFLFAGPTGVGKTELATQIAIAEYGSDTELIQLDMSEFAEAAFGLSKLIGPGPGYVGSDEPEGWLTTRVIAKPRCVVLLDEIEKAHPRVWNVFLQVFDAGRLTDARGNTANFSDVIVIMTSNLGIREANKRVAGFGAEDNAQPDRQLTAIKEALPPELINRFDDIVLFNALSVDAIVEIAGIELESTRNRLGASGWQIEYDDNVPVWLAETGYDPAYGARHLQRNIEREFLGLLAKADSRKLRVRVEDNALIASKI